MWLFVDTALSDTTLCFAAPRALVVAAIALACVAGAAGCVTVRPEQREFLADPSMTFGSGGQAEADMDHVLENREGSAGAATVSGGGCGCN